MAERKKAENDKSIEFSTSAEELRQILNVKIGAVTKPKKINPTSRDRTPFSRLRNGRRIPGWGNTTIFDGTEIKEKNFNKGRQEIKEYVITLLNNLPDGTAKIEADTLIEMVNELLDLAEYAPLDETKRPDDAGLITKIRRVCSSGSNFSRLPAPASYITKVNNIVEDVRKLVLDQISKPVKAEVVNGERAKVTLFKTGVAESLRYQQVSETEELYPGERLYYAPNFSGFSLPKSVRQKFISQYALGEREALHYLKSRENRQKVWEEELKEFSHRDIYEMDGLESWFRDRSFQGVPMSFEEVREQIETLCEQLDRYNNFQVGINPKKLNFNFEIKANRVVLLQPRRNQPADSYYKLLHVQLEGEEHLKNFKLLFEDLWQGCIREKAAVKEWLRNQYHLKYKAN